MQVDDPDVSLFFRHPLIEDIAKKKLYKKGSPCVQPNGSLKISTGANNINWGYGLNTQTYPTYGGEVVQILSAYIDDLEITGDLRSYRQMEEIYSWFILYLEVSTQSVLGHSVHVKGAGPFIGEPITMWYPVREWMFKIRLRELPGFRIATDVVTPKWQIKASILEGDPRAAEHTLENAIADLSKINTGIGYKHNNPFSGYSINREGGYSTEYALQHGTKLIDEFGTMVEDFQEKGFEAAGESLDRLTSNETTKSAKPKK